MTKNSEGTYIDTGTVNSDKTQFELAEVYIGKTFIRMTYR